LRKNSSSGCTVRPELRLSGQEAARLVAEPLPLTNGAGLLGTDMTVLAGW